jgi:glycosyltransferase involved in cell wall biosynthesis
LGRLTHEKGFDLLIDATRALPTDEDFAVVLGGEGPEREILERRARGLGIEFAGYVEDVPAFLGDLDIFCLTSRWEGLPFSLLEAMMAGLPCVAADVGDVAEALGDAGIVVPPENVAALTSALHGLVESRADRLRLGSAAHARAKRHFSVEAMVNSTVNVYAEALAGWT